MLLELESQQIRSYRCRLRPGCAMEMGRGKVRMPRYQGHCLRAVARLIGQ